MVTTESLVDSVVTKWRQFEFPIPASPSLGFFLVSLTLVLRRGGCLVPHEGN